MTRTVLVTGGTSGIGLGIAKALLATSPPHRVDEQRCRSAEKELAEAADGDRVRALAVDTTDETAMRSVVDCVARDWGGLNCLVTAAGVLARGSASELDPEVFVRARARLHTGFSRCSTRQPASRPVR